MAGPSTRILLVEDDAVDRMACRRAFAANPRLDWELIEADTGEAGLRLARSAEPDCILLDYRLPDQTGREFLAQLADAAGEVAIPVIALTGEDSTAVAVEMMRSGARDYLCKDAERKYLQDLPAAIERLLQGQRLLAAKRRAEAMFRTLVEQVQAITYIRALDAAGAIQYISPQVESLGFPVDAWLSDAGLHARLVHPCDRERVHKAVARSVATGGPIRMEYRLIGRDGAERWVRDEAEAVHDVGGRKLFLQGILVDITHNKLNEKALHESREALRRLAAHQERIKENERKRIAQEIHDELGGLLTGIKAHVSVSIERAAQAGAAPDPLLAQAARLSEDAIHAVRRVINDLRPSVLDQLGVWEAIAWYASQVDGRSGLACDCVITPAAAAIELDPDRSTMLFRIVQEALTNVVRHADASLVSVHVSADDGAVMVDIKDDGKGFDAMQPSQRHSWGIQGMQERSRHFGGQLVVSSMPGEGTHVALCLPLEGADVPREGADGQ